MISSDGTTPMKMYERISLRRTRHSSRRLICTNSRQAKNETETIEADRRGAAEDATNRGSSPASRSSPTTILSAAATRNRRPGQD